MAVSPILPNAHLLNASARGAPVKTSVNAAITRRAGITGLAVSALALLTGCASQTGVSGFGETISAGAPAQPAAIGAGQVKVALILPLSATGNAGVAAQSMKNAAELALSEFNNPNIQLLVKDDAGTSANAQFAAQQAMDEGAEIILGPLFAQSVQAVAASARPRGIPVIAFSTDSSVAQRGVYLLSFLPESDAARIVGYAVSTGKRSFVAMFPDNAYGTVVEAAFREAVSRHGARIVAFEKYPSDRSKMKEAVQVVAQGAQNADALFIADGPDAVPFIVRSLNDAGVNTRRLQLLGTGLWDDPRIFGETAVQGGAFAAPDPSGFASFSRRYRAKYGQDPVRTATLAYDATALVAALVKTQGAQRFSEEVLTNPSGFAGIDGLIRFKANGINERGLAVLRVGPSGGQVVSPAPKAFGGSGT
jgi:ABC-type branched-subunit amino acid transport system substrate-binding protein